MLISECTIFGPEADQQLVSMYLAQDQSLTKPELSGVDPDWWHEVLRRKMPEGTRHQLIQDFLACRNTYANNFILGALNENERVLFYKWVLGFRDDQAISLGEMISKDEQQLSAISVDDVCHLVHKAINGNDQWQALQHYLPLVPVPMSLEQAVSKLMWEIREIIMSVNGGKSASGSFDDFLKNSPVDNLFISGQFNRYLWRHAGHDVVQKLHDEYCALPKPSDENEIAVFHDNYHIRSFLALQNRHVNGELKNKIFETLFEHTYGQVKASNICNFLPLLKSYLIPNRYFKLVLDDFIEMLADASQPGRLISGDREADFNAFMDDPRITDSDRNVIFGLLKLSNQVLKHNYFRQQDGSYKHARELSEQEVIDFLEISTMGLVTPNGISSDYEAMAMALIEDNVPEKELMARIDSSRNALFSLFKNNKLNEEQVRQLVHIFMFTNQAYMMEVFMVDNDTPNKVFDDLDCDLGGYITQFPRPNSMKHELFSQKIGTIYLSRINECAEYAEIYLRKHISEKGLPVKESNFSLNSGEPSLSLHALLAAMEHRPGSAFSVLEHLFSECPSLDVGPIGTPDWQRLGCGTINEIEKVGALTRWAMTQEVYPALLDGSELDPNVLAKTLALAVRDCNIDAFDIQVFSHAQKREHFNMVAGLLLDNPQFGERHTEAYEALTAEMLKRKADACMTSVMSTKPSRPHL